MLLEDAKREKDKEARQGKENYDRCQSLYTEISNLKMEIQAQHTAIIEKHKEIDTLRKTADVYKKLVDEINDRFGGMNSVDEQIRMAKHKEKAVAQLLTQLENTLVSFAPANRDLVIVRM